MKKGTILLVFVILVFCVFFYGEIHGKVKGVVEDKEGNPIKDVTVTISAIKYASVRYTLKTNEKGEFFQIGLQPEYYQIKAEKDGYLPVIIEKRVRMQVVTQVPLEMEEDKYHISKSPGKDDFNRGIQLFEAGNFEKAALAFEKASELEPFEPIYKNNLGVAYAKMKKYDEAIEAYKKMIDIQPESYTAYKQLGELHGLKQEFQAAIPYYTKATELSQEDPVAFYDLGACLINIQDYPRSIEALSMAVSLKPDYAIAYYQLGMVYVNQNQKEAAIKSLEKFLELAPEDPQAAVAKQLVDYLKSGL